MTEPNEPEEISGPSYEELVEERNRPRTPHHALKLAVRAGEITPRQAEEKAREQGLPLLHDGWEGLHDITTNSVWWLPQTILFLAWRDLKHAREQWERFQVWGYDLWRDPCIYPQIESLESAEKALLTDLRSGVFRAFGENAEGNNRLIPCEEWEYLSIGHGIGFSTVMLDGAVVYNSVSLLRHEVVPFFILEPWVSAGLSASELQRERGDQPSVKRGGGRPTTHDWAAAAGYVSGFITENDYPKDKREEEKGKILSVLVRDWFENERGKAPDIRDIQRFVAEVYKHQRPSQAPPKK